MLLNCLCVGAGGALGAVCRYLIGLIPLEEHGFPLKTLIVNVAGAFAIGLIAALATRGKGWDPHLLLLLKVGVCGGFTTFSTFAFETSALLQGGSVGMALGYVLTSLVLGVLAVFGAMALVR